MFRRNLVLLLLPLMVSNCAAHGSDDWSEARQKVKHVVIIVQENRSFDNLFHDFPGADTAQAGRTHTGRTVSLHPISLRAQYDISNGVHDFLISYDGGRMDGWDLRHTNRPRVHSHQRYGRNPEYGFVPYGEVRPYWTLATQYVLADRMFQSNLDQSFAAHLYLIASQAGRAVDIPSGRPWGCDSGPRVRVRTLNDDRTLGKSVFPCFDFPTLGDELALHNLTWRYYAPKVDSPSTWRNAARLRRANKHASKGAPDFGQVYSSYDAVAHVRYGPSWQTNVVSPPSQILADVRSGALANVTWVIPDFRDSDHPGTQSMSGPSWVSAVVNAIGKSANWTDTVIFIVWDDSGGWYDHVKPPQLDYDGLGFRVPLIIVSPYARKHVVIHGQYEFGSLLRFTEDLFRLPHLTDADKRAASPLEAFNFWQTPRPYSQVYAPLPPKIFESEPPSNIPPDND